MSHTFTRYSQSELRDLADEWQATYRARRTSGSTHRNALYAGSQDAAAYGLLNYYLAWCEDRTQRDGRDLRGGAIR